MLDELDYPMFIATVPGDGCLVGFATQCSIDPLRFLVCLSNKNRTYRLARDASHMAVHVVPEDRMDLAELFGGETADDVDKLGADRVSRRDRARVPLLAGLPVRRRAGRRHVRRSATTSRSCSTWNSSDGAAKPLRFQRARAIDPGHEA